MNAEVKQKWIAALKSGEYRQTVGTLIDGEKKFCCLGVLCDLYVKEKSIEKWPWRFDETYLPKEVKEWSGVHSDAGKYVGQGFSGDRYLADDNDIVGNTFEEIAETIEKHF